jgi:hypothetical protein
MTATSDDLTMYTQGQYTVGAASTDTITAATYAIFLADAELDATTDGISSAYFDRAVTYLIADIIYGGLPGSDKQSEKISTTSYTKFDEESQWRKEYNKVKANSDANGGASGGSIIPSTMVKREDSTIVSFDSNAPIIPYDTTKELA